MVSENIGKAIMGLEIQLDRIEARLECATNPQELQVLHREYGRISRKLRQLERKLDN